MDSFEQYKKDFPILKQKINHNDLVYFDSAATAQKPQSVLDTIQNYYVAANANVHRGVHTLSERATVAYESVREKVQQFINASSVDEIIYVRGTTEAINLVAESYGRSHIKTNDEIIISEMEHHSNIVPWQLLAEQVGAVLRYIPVTDSGELDMDVYKDLLSERTKLVAVTHVSNVLGTVNPVKQIIDMAHQYEVPVLLDGAVSAPHMPVDVQELDCDFYAFSGHKLYGPTGIGILYGKAERLKTMPPYQSGGAMINKVTLEKSTFQMAPHKFEAGTPNIAGVVGLGAAIDYCQAIGMSQIQQHNAYLLSYLLQQFKDVYGLQVLGDLQQRLGAVSFVLENAHPHDIATILNEYGIAVRAGHHCAMPLMQRLGVPATTRVSFGLYNTLADVDSLIIGLKKVQEVFKR